MDESPKYGMEFVTRFCWLDRGGVARTIEVYGERTPDAQVRAYVRDEEGDLHLVAAIREDGIFYHLARERAERYGLDTEAAWNDLFGVCWSAHMPSTPTAWRG